MVAGLFAAGAGEKSGSTKKRSRVEPDTITLKEAAAYLRCSSRSLERWIARGWITREDGLRYFGDLPRFYFPQLKQRNAEGTLMADRHKRRGRGDDDESGGGRLGSVALLPVTLLLAWTLLAHPIRRPMAEYPLLIRHHRTLQQKVISL